MSRYRIDLPPMSVNGVSQKYRWETAADLVKRALEAEGITNYEPVESERFPGCASLSLRGVTVVQQYDVTGDGWLACGIVRTAEAGA